jgi:alkylation response protein AidB-like acyl-CoA dehydrogenase
VTGYLDKTYAKKVAGDPRAVFGGVFAPKGRAVVDGDDYVADGRWPFASGCGHCTWLMGGCVVFEGDKPRMVSDGVADTRMLLFPASNATIHDTWDVAGLCGTGSHDMEITGERVPAALSVALGRDEPFEDGPLYRFPVFGLLATGIAAVALGIARRAIDEFASLATTKVATGQRKRLADRGTIQAEAASAEAELRSGRAFLYETIDRCWEDAVAGAIRPRERAVLRLAASHATTCAARAVDRVYEAGGGTSIYRSSPLQRCFRDVHVATQHLMVAAGSRELAGRILLGVQDDEPLL